MGGVDDQDRVELEADRPRLDAAHAGQHEGTQELLISQSVLDALGHLGDQLLARRVFDKTDQGLDVGAERDDGNGNFRGREVGKLGQKRQAGCAAGLNRMVQEPSTRDGVEHGEPSVPCCCSVASGRCSALACCRRPR